MINQKENFDIAYNILECKRKKAKSFGKMHFRFAKEILTLVEYGNTEQLKKILKKEKEE